MPTDQRAWSRSLKVEAVHGMFWTYLSLVSGKGMMFVTTIILARLLSPRDFGVVGLCLIAINYFDAINAVGMGSALIARRDRIVEAANAAFFMSMLVSGMLLGAAWISAPWIATFFREPQVTGLLRILAVVLVTGQVGMVPGAMLQRDLRFRRKIIAELARNMSRGLASIVLALLGMGVWSLVLGQIVGSVAGVSTAWVLAGWHPTLSFDRKVSREMLDYGGHIFGVTIIGTVQNNVDYLLVGRFLGATALGYYTLAYRIPELIIRNLHLVISNVAFPVLAQIQTDMTRLRSIYFSYVRYIGLITFPAGVGLALIAPVFIKTFYTSKWDPAITVMQFIALALAVNSISYVPGVLYKAINCPKILTATATVKIGFVVASLWLSVRWGISGVAVAQFVIACVTMLLDCVIVSRVVGFRVYETARSLVPALVGSAIMGATVGLVQFLVKPAGIAGLVLLIATGAVAYGAALFLFSRETVERAGSLMREALVRTG